MSRRVCVRVPGTDTPDPVKSPARCGRIREFGWNSCLISDQVNPGTASLTQLPVWSRPDSTSIPTSRRSGIRPREAYQDGTDFSPKQRLEVVQERAPPGVHPRWCQRAPTESSGQVIQSRAVSRIPGKRFTRKSLNSAQWPGTCPWTPDDDNPALSRVATSVRPLPAGSGAPT
jgi:hypothetical protein